MVLSGTIEVRCLVLWVKGQDMRNVHEYRPSRIQCRGCEKRGSNRRTPRVQARAIVRVRFAASRHSAAGYRAFELGNQRCNRRRWLIGLHPNTYTRRVLRQRSRAAAALSWSATNGSTAPTSLARYGLYNRITLNRGAPVDADRRHLFSIFCLFRMHGRRGNAVSLSPLLNFFAF